MSEPSSYEFNIDLERFMRRRSLSGQTLSSSVNVYGDECLRDLLLRAAAENGHVDVDHVLRLLRSGSARPRSLSSADLDTWIDRSALRDVLGLSATEPRPPFEVSLNLGTQTFFGTTIRKPHIFRGVRLSPRSLKVALYYKAAWRVSPLTFDPNTREILLERCPVPSCNSKFSSKNTLGLQYCWACGNRELENGAPYRYIDLRDFAQPLVHVDDEEALDFAIGLIDPQKSDGTKRISALHDDFSSLHRGGVFNFIAVVGGHLGTLGNACGTLIPTRTRRRPMVGYTVEPPALAEAARMVLAWPSRFQEFLSHVRQLRPDVPDYPGRFFRSHGFTPQFRKTILGLINDERRISRASGMLQKATESQNSMDALFAETVPLIQVRRCHNEESVSAGTDWDRYPVDIGDDQVRLTVLRKKPGIQTLANAIGVPTYEFNHLVKQKLLAPSVVDLNSGEQLHLAARPLVESLVGQRSRKGMPKKVFSLGRAMNAISLRLEQPWTHLLLAATQGLFEYWFDRSRGVSLFNSIKIQNLDLLRATILESPPSAQSRRKYLLSNSDAAITLCTMPGGFSKYVREGLLNTPSTLEELQRVRVKYLLACEISTRLAEEGSVGRGHKSVTSEMAQKGISFVAGRNLTLWDRAQAEALYGSSLKPCIFDEPLETHNV